MHAGEGVPEEVAGDLSDPQDVEPADEGEVLLSAQSSNSPVYTAGTTGVGMDGVDVSGHQPDFASSGWTNYQFAIVKATEGTSFTSSTVTEQATKVLNDGKLLGFYHFVGGSGATAEAEYFVNVVRPYIGKAILVLDWEGNGTGGGVAYAKAFLDHVYELTGVKPLIYMSYAVTNSNDWSAVANAGYDLWVARYLWRYDNTWLSQNTNNSYGYTEFLGYAREPASGNGAGAWGSPTIYQYSSTAKVGYSNGHLDIDKFYGSAADWNRLAAPENINHVPLGTFDGCTGGSGTVTVRGWAFDPDEPAKQLGIHVYVDGPAGTGSYLGAGTANVYRPDVDNVHHTGANHGFEFTVSCPAGTHAIYVHALDTAGGHNPYLGGGATNDGAITVSVGEAPPADKEAPVISEVRISDLSSEGYTVACTVTDNVGVERVTFPTWTVAGGQDDILKGGELNDGYLGVHDGDTWSFRVDSSDHNGEAGQYITHIYAWDAAGNKSSIGNELDVLHVEVPEPSGTAYPAGDINGDGSVNNKDVTRLFQYLSDWEVDVVEGNLDTNGDGSVNNKDLTRLFQYLSDWDVEIHGGAA